MLTKENVVEIICKMIEYGKISIAVVQGMSNIGYIDAKNIVNLCLTNNLVKMDDGENHIPILTVDEFKNRVDSGALDLNLPIREREQEKDLVFLVSEYTDLIPIKGRQKYFAICPFHNEKQPSLIINAEKEPQHFHCFGCGVCGDCDDFQMLIKDRGIKKTVNK